MGKTAYFAIGYKCNHKCIFCPRSLSDFSDMMSYEELTSNVERVFEHTDLTNIIVSGGEPTMHPDFIRFLQFLTNKNLRVTVLSNGDNFSNRSYADMFIREINPKAVSVVTAIHSTNPLEHDRITNSPGSYERSMKGLQYLSKAGYHIGIKFILTKQNYSICKEYVKDILEKFEGNADIQICGVDCSGNAEARKYDAAISFCTARPYLEEALDYYIEMQSTYPKTRITLSEMPLCSVDPYYWKYFTMKDPSAHVAYSAPNCDENEEHLSFNSISACATFFQKCKTCKAEPLCPGIWRSTYEALDEDAVKAFL